MAQCYALVRGSALRVTDLEGCGSLTDTIRYAVSKAVASVRVNEITEAGRNELLRNDEGEPRIHIVRPEQTIRYSIDVDFLRVDPGVLSIVAGVPVVRNAAGDVVGFDANTRLPVSAFGLEVWSNLVGPCRDGKRWGYTLFPYVKGGFLTGFRFENGLVSFNLRNARTQRYPGWGSGPYDLEGVHQRLYERIAGSTNYRQITTSSAPPEQTEGTVEFRDVIDGGNAETSSSDILDGEFVITSGWRIDGGGA